MSSKHDYSDPAHYRDLLNRIGEESKVLVLGGLDSGKTTLIRSLRTQLGGEVVDGDVGQSNIGPPGLVSRGYYGDGLKGAYFVGDITPRGNLVQVCTGLSRMSREAKRPCFIDTDGWIEGSVGRLYKSHMIDLVNPDFLVLMGENSEMEYFSSWYISQKTYSMTVSETRSTSRGERLADRERRFKYYFSQAGDRTRSWSKLLLCNTSLGYGERLDPTKIEGYFDGRVLAGWKWGDQVSVISEGGLNSPRQFKSSLHVTDVNVKTIPELEYLLVGCFRSREFVGLGTITEITERGLQVLTPAKKFDRLRFGKIYVSPSGEHDRGDR